MAHSPLRKFFAAGALVLATASLTACSEVESILREFDSFAEGVESTEEAPAVAQDDDYFTVTGKAKLEYDAAVGEVDYCPVDSLERPTCSYGLLTYEVRAEAKERGRQDLNTDPVGWPDSNPKVSIPALEGVEGSKDYNGYMWNRSHLLADSLGGSVEARNLVPGTRTQNVGSAKNSGGMAYTETIARDYLDEKSSSECPLYYAATPQYEGNELVPRTVTVDIQSCDNSIDERVVVSNTANGFAIDYRDGSFTEE